MKLAELAALIRSKNAGPFVLTFDVIFATPEAYQRVKRSGLLSAATFARLFDVAKKDVRFFDCENALAFKFSIPRPIPQADLGDGDLHGGQQYAPLMTLDIP